MRDLDKQTRKRGPEGKAPGGPSPHSGARIPVVQAEGQERGEDCKGCAWNHIPRAGMDCRHGHISSGPPPGHPLERSGGGIVFSFLASLRKLSGHTNVIRITITAVY